MVFLKCVLAWSVRSLFCVKPLSHWLYWYGFSLVCVVICFVSLLLRESLNTLGALIWLLFSVSLKMMSEIIMIRKSLITLIALLWFLTSVQSHMFCKNTFLHKSLITIVALIWFLPSVYSYMFCKMPLLWEKLIT